MFYELWDFKTRNVIGYFDTQDDALRRVREILDTYGAEEAMSFGLGTEDDNGESRAVAEGAELVELARALPAHVSERT